MRIPENIKTIYLVVAREACEQDIPIVAFPNDVDAQLFCIECEKYTATRSA